MKTPDRADVTPRGAVRRGARHGQWQRHVHRAPPSPCGRNADARSWIIVPMTAAEAAISVVPANEASCEDLHTLFGAHGAAAWCQCQRYKLRPRESFRSFPVEERARRLREQTDCGHPESDRTSGLVAYLDAQPVGWCAVEPRTAYEGLLRVFRVPWDGRDEDKTDDTVWAVTCLFARAGFRKRGVSRALARAAVASPAGGAPAPSRPTRSPPRTSSPRSCTSGRPACSPTPASSR